MSHSCHGARMSSKGRRGGHHRHFARVCFEGAVLLLVNECSLTGLGNENELEVISHGLLDPRGLRPAAEVLECPTGKDQRLFATEYPVCSFSASMLERMDVNSRPPLRVRAAAGRKVSKGVCRN